MKRAILIFLFLCTLQQSIAAGFVKQDTIEVSFFKTVVLIFEKPVISDDVGSPDLLIESEGEKVKLAAAVQGMHETNLFIETGDGYYSFIIRYNANPKTLTHFYPGIKVTYPKSNVVASPQVIQDTKTSMEAKQAAVEGEKQNSYFKKCEMIAKRTNSFSDIGVFSARASVTLGDIYVSEDMLYFKIVMKNMSNIDYDVELIRFVVRHKKGVIKQAASQETIMEPVYVYNGDINEIKGKDGLIKIFVFKKFTIANEKKLVVELWEDGGDRILNFAISEDMILHTKRFEQ